MGSEESFSNITEVCQTALGKCMTESFSFFALKSFLFFKDSFHAIPWIYESAIVIHWSTPFTLPSATLTLRLQPKPACLKTFLSGKLRLASISPSLLAAAIKPNQSAYQPGTMIHFVLMFPWRWRWRLERQSQSSPESWQVYGGGGRRGIFMSPGAVQAWLVHLWRLWRWWWGLHSGRRWRRIQR